MPPSDTAPILRTSGLTKSFAGNVVLSQVGFDVYPGEIHALMGENGAGKSTWINLVTGVHQPDSGTIEFDGVSYAGLSPRQAEAIGISTVHQELSLSPHLTVAENIYLGRLPTTGLGQVDYQKIETESARIFADFGVQIDPKALAGELPLAEQQLVEFAKALVAEPKLLILDEATSALDKNQVELFFDSLRVLRERGVAVIFVSHRLEEIFSITDRITVLKNGEYVTTVPTATTSTDELVTYMVGREISDIFPPKPPIDELMSAPVVLSVRNLSSGHRFQNVDFDLHQGEILGLGGLQGQGQRELLAALFGLHRVEGEVTLNGQRAPARNPRAAISQRYAFVPEDRKTEGLILQLPVNDNLALPNLNKVSRYGLIDRSRERGLIDSLVAKLQIRLQSSKQKVMRLSGGNQQKVAIAKWLPQDPEILLLSEPTRGIDVGTKQEIHRLMRELTSAGASILLISSDTIELLGLSDRVLVMYEHRPVVTLSGADVTEENVVHASVVGGEGAVAARLADDAGSVPAETPEAIQGRSLNPLAKLGIFSKLSRAWQDVLPIYAVTAVFALIYLYMTRNTFGIDTVNNLSAWLFPLFLATMSQSVIMLTGGIDLSTGNMMSLFTCLLATQMWDSPLSMAKAVTMVLVGGALIGLFTGAIVSYIKLPAIIVTLATSFIWAGAALWVLPSAGGHLPRSFSSRFIGQIGGIVPVSMIVLILALLFWRYAIKRTPIGVGIYAIGDNERGAFFSGLPVKNLRIAAYIVAGLFAALAGIGLSAYAGSGDPLIGGTYTLAAIAAAVLGGVSFLGGQGHLRGTIAGVLSLGLVTQVLFISGFSVAYQRVIYGLVLIVAIGIKTFAAYRIEERR
ncbi:MAG: ATP-binding cassette domain-containing protein [Thermomicrobiales bacterium]|nr:ATP-binding cassette domain-containing protein [Thermomicrobiales bacterium]